MKRLFMALIVCLITINVQAQRNVNLGADIYSRNILKGYNVGGSSPSIQPYLNYLLETENSKFSTGVLAAYTLSPTACQEVDLFINYTYRSIGIQITDIFFPELYSGARDNYFNYGDSTCHTIEAKIIYNSTEIPFDINASANIYGNDARDSSGNILYTKYVEIGYNHSNDNMSYRIFVGALLDNPDGIGFYGNKTAGVCNVGIRVNKNLDLNNHQIPLSVQLITNPEASKIYLVFGISL